MLKSAYKFWRLRGYNAAESLQRARGDVANNVSRYPYDLTHRNFYFSAYGSTRMLWIEEPSKYGLRRVGFADEIARSIDHIGWFLDQFCDETVRGVVYQLPGKHGRARYVSGYADPYNDGAACLDMGTIHIGDVLNVCSTTCDDSAAIDAALSADRIAELMAEREREYRAAWQAGRMYAETLDEIAAHKSRIKLLLEDRKRAKLLGDPEKFPTICAIIREHVSQSLKEISELRAKRDKLANGDYSEGDMYYGFDIFDDSLVAAFNDGAGDNVIETRKCTSAGFITA